MSNTGTQAVDRAAQLLTRVVQADAPITFSELVEESGLARSTTSRLLAALETHQLLERGANGTYTSGVLFAQYAARHDPWSQVARLAGPVLQDIGEQTGETVNLAVPSGDTVIQIAQVDSTYLLGARDWMQVTVPAHCSALGKALYAFGALAMPRGRLNRLTPHSLGTAADLRRVSEHIREVGYAVTRDELEIGLTAVAAPVRGPDGEVFAAVGVSGPSGRLGDSLHEVGTLLMKHADSLSDLLGGTSNIEGAQMRKALA
jgi:IclR family acetate operon transcriptional repressor